MRVTSLLEFRRVVLDPAVNGGMIDLETTLPHHLLKISIAQRIAKMPSYTEQDHLGLEVTPFEWILALVFQKGGPLSLFSIDYSRSTFFMQHNLSDCRNSLPLCFSSSRSFSLTPSNEVGLAIIHKPCFRTSHVLTNAFPTRILYPVHWIF